MPITNSNWEPIAVSPEHENWCGRNPIQSHLDYETSTPLLFSKEETDRSNQRPTSAELPRIKLKIECLHRCRANQSIHVVTDSQDKNTRLMYLQPHVKVTSNYPGFFFELEATQKFEWLKRHLCVRTDHVPKFNNQNFVVCGGSDLWIHFCCTPFMSRVTFVNQHTPVSSHLGNNNWNHCCHDCTPGSNTNFWWRVCITTGNLEVITSLLPMLWQVVVGVKSRYIYRLAHHDERNRIHPRISRTHAWDAPQK